MAGVSGGHNTVNAFDLASMTRTVIHSGDPQPSAVAVAPNGNVYWTSTSRGVIMAAVPTSAPTATAQFAATLSGSEEVPPVTTQATGQATFSLNSGSRVSDDHVSSGQALRYTLSLTGIQNVLKLSI